MQQSVFESYEAIAPLYDAAFVQNAAAMEQRRIAWDAMSKLFSPGSHVVDLACGTGEDAIFLARLGIQVTACDGSGAMAEIARQRVAREGLDSSVRVLQLTFEELRQLEGQQFSGALSNFGGLDSVEDLRTFAQSLARLLPPGAPFLACMTSRFSLFELAGNLACFRPSRAVRRWKGYVEISKPPGAARYRCRTVEEIRNAFSAHFRLRSVTALGLLTPAISFGRWAEAHPALVQLLGRIDRPLRALPLLRVFGDHHLVSFTRNEDTSTTG
jgi:ubiquinone/menaquinone biosynthesis C-methylase UbiE